MKSFSVDKKDDSFQLIVNQNELVTQIELHLNMKDLKQMVKGTIQNTMV